MFFCIGENDMQACHTGAGRTIHDAIKNWSTSGDVWSDIIEEFEKYNPRIIQGEELRIEFEVSEPVINIV